MIALVVIGWVACGVLSYGIGNAAWYWWAQNKIPGLQRSSRDYAGVEGFYAMMGPLGLVINLFWTNFAQHGIKFKSWETRGR